MNGRFSHKLRKIHGFTLSELLMVVGILAILSAVSFPAIINMRNSLRQSELDEKAKQIFITAQNCLSGLSLSGVTLEVYPEGNGGFELGEDKVPDDYATAYGQKPDTYVLCDGDGGSFTWMNDTVFSPALVREDGASYAIEFNRYTNVVYGVYYWEREGAAFQKKSLFDYHANFNEYDGRPLRGPENKKNRMVPSVGYYGGEAAAALKERKEVEFQVSVYNEERLETVISMPPALYQDAVFEVVVASKTDGGNGNRYSYRVHNGEIKVLAPEDTFHGSDAIWKANPASGGEMSASYVLTLDSLESGLHFADHFKGIAAGDDLRISVTGYCLGSDAVYIPKTLAVETNSLFAGIRGSDGTSGEVWVENGRHLQNLSYEVSGLGYSTDGASEWRSGFPVTCAKVLEDIDWTEPVYDGQSYDDVCTTRLDFSNPQGTSAPGRNHFYPISNHKTELNAFMGGRHVIKGIHVTQGASISYYEGVPSGYAGLFGFMEAKQDRGEAGTKSKDEGKYNIIQDVMLVNPHIGTEQQADSFPGGSYAGSLAGYVDKVTIKNCGVYIDGAEDEDISGIYDQTGVVTAFQYGGGLIGKARDLAAQDSFASVRVEAGQAAGGFIGALAGGSDISTCYSGGHTVSGTYVADQPNVKAPGTAGGFVGELGGGGEIKNSFSACSVSALQCGPFAGWQSAGSEGILLEATYGVGSAFVQYNGHEPNIIGCGSTEEALARGARKAAAGSTFPYDTIYRMDDNAAYLYPIWLGAYRGDWAGGSFTGLVYYEKYQTSEEDQDGFGFWYPDAEGNGSLRDDLPVISDGYGYLSDMARTVKLSANGDLNSSQALPAVQNVRSEGKSLYLYALPWADTHKSFDGFSPPGGQTGAFYDTLAFTVDGASFTAYYNPHFAKAMVYTQEQAMEKPDYAIIRTARHLYELGFDVGRDSGNNTHYWKAGWDYIQERDLDYGIYNTRETYPDPDSGPGELRQGMIGRTKLADFRQSYDGGGHRISNLVLTDESVGTGTVNGMALFGYTGEQTGLHDMVLYRPCVTTQTGYSVSGLVYTNCGSIMDVTLVSPDIDASGSYMSRAAGLVYENVSGARIEGCYIIPEQPDGQEDGTDGSLQRFRHIYGEDGKVAVNNYSNARITASGCASGLVGENRGVIRNCAVAACVTASDDGNGAAAGFVFVNGNQSGAAADGRALIEDSYANCYTAGREAAGFVYGTGRASGINRCYALRRVMTTSASGIAAGFSVNDVKGTISNSYAAVSNGYCSNYQVLPDGGILYPDCQYAGIQGHGAGFYPFSGTRQDNCFYMEWMENASEEEKPDDENAAALTFAELKKQSIPGLTSANQDGSDTVTFSRMLPGIYPFPKAVDMVQYGDWPNYEYVGAELAYFEIYEDGPDYSVGFYNEELGLDSLQDKRKIFMDGYGLFFNTEYLDMDGINVKNLIQGNSSSNDKAYLSWEDWNGNDNTTAYTTNYLKSVYNLRDNHGKKIEKGVSYYKTSGSGKNAIGVGKGDGFPDQPIELNLNNRKGTYYFRILPPAAVVTNAYVPSDSIYQQISIHVESNYYDEMGGISAGIVKKDREFYYCPHFAKSKISTDERPEDPEYLYIRTTRQLCTLSSGNQVPGSSGEGLQNYYGKSFRQEQDIDLGRDNPYAYHYSDTAPLNEVRGRSGYRWFNSPIGSYSAPFEGIYDGGGYSISGLGAWDSRPGGSGEGAFDKITPNRDVALFGYLSSATVKELVIKNVSMDKRSEELKGILCCGASSGTTIEGVTIESASLDIRNFAPGSEAFGLLAGTLSDSAIKNCRLDRSMIQCGNTQVKYIGGAVGRLTGSGTIDGLIMDDVSVGGTKATHLGGAVGFMDSGQVHQVSLTGTGSGTAVMEGDRAAGGIIGQINSEKGPVTIGNISLAGMITVRQTIASNNTKLYNGAGLTAGLCELSNYPVSIAEVRVQGTDGSVLVENASASRYHIGGFVIGSLYKSSGNAVQSSLSLGNIGVHGARLASSDPGQNNTYCGYGGLMGQSSKAAVLSEGSSWDFSGSSISITAQENANRYHGDSGVAGLIGKCLDTASMKLPKDVILPELTVRVQAGGSIPVGGVTNGTANRFLTVQAADQKYSGIKINSIMTENCQDTGGLTSVLTDNTVFNGLSVEGVPSDGISSRTGYIQGAGNVGGIAGTISTGPSNRISRLSVNGLDITGAGNIGGFAGCMKSGAVEQCYSYADITALYPSDSAAGGFVGKIENGTIARCYASGNVDALGEDGITVILRAGGFFGDITSAGRIENCYASGDVSLQPVNAGLGSALGGFGGSISSDKAGQVTVTKCYSVGAVTIGAAAPGFVDVDADVPGTAADVGGFIGHLAMSGDVLNAPDEMVQDLIRIMKDAEVHNRGADQNGKTIWKLDVGMDSETRGIFDNSNISALVYNILGYPEYPGLLKVNRENTTGKASNEEIKAAYEKTFDETGQLNPVQPSLSGDSYYHTFFLKSRDKAMMTMWSIKKTAEGKYLYWINEETPVSGMTCTGYRVNLDEYDRVLTQEPDATDRRQDLIETKQVRVALMNPGAYDGKAYPYLADLNGTWRKPERAAVSECFFLREDGLSMSPHNADYGPVDAYIEPWNLAQFSQEMTWEAGGSEDAVLTGMRPAPENTGPGYGGYPFPMLESVGAGVDDWFHTGRWPVGYQPYYNTTP